MKRLIIIFFALFSIAANAQQYNNEWIDYSKTYYKFKVGSSGLYRIPQSALASIGLSATDVAQFQLWRNGTEIPIFTTAQSGVLPAGGYIEFWGEANDGKPDNALYRNPNDQINNTGSIFSDTAAYFLTVNPAGGNKRLMPAANTIPAGAVAEPYFMHTRIFPFNETLHMGRPEGSGTGSLYTASYEQGKGWASGEIGNGGTRSFAENLFAYTGAGVAAPEVKMNVVGNTNTTRNVQLAINGNLIFDNQLVGYNYARYSKSISSSILNGNNETFLFSNTATAVDRVRLAVIELTYPRTFNFGGLSNFRFTIPANTTGKYLEISGFNFSGSPVLYDLAGGKRYEVDATNPALLKVFLPPSAIGQDLVLVSQGASGIKTVSQFEARNFVNYLLPANQGDYLMITHNSILNGANGSKPVEDYRAYRSSAAGGGYNAKVFMIDQLTDQFAFGIKYSPLAVRNFARWARNKFSVLPKQIFLAGKGVSYSISRVYENTYPVEIATLAMIPTMGNPGSDVLLTAEGASSVPLTPIGRLSIVNGDELTVYLNKVKQYESGLNNPSSLISESAWKKDVIHMVGANDQPTIEILYHLLNNHKAVIQDTLFGAKVSDYVRSYTTSVQQVTSERLANQINNGSGLLTYFGHSSATTLGFNLEDPMNYNNQGKYPLFNMMGCDVGNIFGLNGGRIAGPSVLSEKYVLANQRGSIGMLAGTSVGYVSTLDFYNLTLYKKLSTTHYGKSIGELMKATIEGVFAAVGENAQLQRSQCEEYTLNGDPAIRLYQFDKPDYAIEDQLINVSPAFVSIAETSFQVNAKLMNLGKALNGNVIVELKRTYPDLSTAVIKRDTIRGIRYADSLHYNIPIDPVKDKGLNKITITIDPENTITELFETNNSITKDVFIFEDELRPVFPYDYAIINKQGIKFSASTANPLAESRNYLFEIDTTKLFNSSLKVSQNKTSKGGLLEFTPGITFKDPTVYYWRVASAPAPNEQPKWNTVSFIYINGPEIGFNQSHYYQFAENDLERMYIDSATREFRYRVLKHEIIVKSGVFPTAFSLGSQFSVTVDDNADNSSVCGVSGIVFSVYDKNTLLPWRNANVGSPGRFGSDPVCGPTRVWNFQYNILDENKRRSAAQFLDSIPDGSLVVVRNISGTDPGSNTYAPQWKNDENIFGSGSTIYHKLKAQGFSTIDSFTRPRAFIFVYQKNNSSFSPVSTFSNGIYDRIETKFNFFAPDSVGIMRSNSFGPAREWKKLQWEKTPSSTSSTDTSTFSLIGVRKNGAEAVLKTNILEADKEIDISDINAAEFPRLKLVLNTLDNKSFYPYQLKYWRLYYSPVSEGAIAPNLFFSHKDTLEVGEPLNFGVAFKNVSEYNFSDSMKVKFTIRDKNNNENIVNLPSQKLLIAGDTIRLNVQVSSQKFIGHNSVFVEFNPNGAQPEQYHFNNFLYQNFYVKGDSTNPYLDVTFDGVHILNKDIVSSKPNILMKLTDDAKWMLLNSSDLVKVQLKFPDGTLRNFGFNNDTLVFTPASQSNSNVATINFRPHLLVDGNYELIVVAKDQSGNNAGDMQYRVAFQVINKPMISNLLNYPNPFTTSTAFVFTLTGSEIPQNIRIQILTITGKIVREITKNELGPIKIGRNITEYKWDGTDQYGQKLANGVYLYRVITNLNGKSLEKYQAAGDNTDKYFNKGYGKMYLMR